MVYFMENPTKMDENWGYPPILENPISNRPIRVVGIPLLDYYNPQYIG